MSHPDPISSFRLRAIEVTGPDAIPFMQSQLTIDLESKADSRLHPAGWCSPNGRTEAVLLIAVDGDTVWLVLPEALVENVVKRARMFSIGRKVALGQAIEARPAVAPAVRYQAVYTLALDTKRSLALGAADDGVNQQATELPDEWLQADIDCAMPWLLSDTAGAYLPQMLGLDALGGLSFKKGCFPGQEVIARVHYRSRVKRRVSRFRLNTDSPPAPGHQFELAGKSAQVLYAAAEHASPGCATGLAVVSTDAQENAAIEIDLSTGALF